ncbi:STAS domain-containing protein [Paraburkholderia caledonica]|uniref:STAS domain-containing protein n=1 Tax=Paraburkholderia caledonica TaxID=134536 RepID=UPI0038BBF21A
MAVRLLGDIFNRPDTVIPLPNRLTKETMYPLLSNVLRQVSSGKNPPIQIDFSTLKFIDSAGVTVLSNLISFLRRLDVKVNPKGHKGLTEPIKYLDDSGFFQSFYGYSISENPEVRPTTLPLQLVEYPRSYEYMGFKLVPWLARALKTEDRCLGAVQVCFQEIFNNINDHSGVGIGCSFAQHYPKDDTIQFTVSDFGMGIPKRVRTLQPELNDQQAIQKATEQGFTTQTTIRNRGAGLDVLIKNVVNKNGGAVMIHSGRGILSCVRTPDGTVKRSPRPAPGFYPGTLIQMALHTDTFVSDIADEEFEW